MVIWKPFRKFRMKGGLSTQTEYMVHDTMYKYGSSGFTRPFSLLQILPVPPALPPAHQINNRRQDKKAKEKKRAVIILHNQKVDHATNADSNAHEPKAF